MNDWLNDVAPQLFQTLAVLVGFTLVAVVLTRMGSRAIGRIKSSDIDREQRFQTLWSAARRVILVVLAVVAVLTVMSVWGISLTPLLAVGSAVGIAVGFGAQEAVKDMIAGFLILAEGQFDIGDTVTISNVTGEVTEIRLRVTVLRDLDGTAHFVPNGQISVASNFTKEFSRAILDISVAYDSDLDKVKAVLEDEILAIESEFPELFSGEGSVMGVNQLDASAIVWRLMFVTTADDRWRVKRLALERMAKRLNAEGITIPFPTINLANSG